MDGSWAIRSCRIEVPVRGRPTMMIGATIRCSATAGWSLRQRISARRCGQVADDAVAGHPDTDLVELGRSGRAILDVALQALAPGRLTEVVEPPGRVDRRLDQLVGCAHRTGRGHLLVPLWMSLHGPVLRAAAPRATRGAARAGRAGRPLPSVATHSSHGEAGRRHGHRADHARPRVAGDQVVEAGAHRVGDRHLPVDVEVAASTPSSPATTVRASPAPGTCRGARRSPPRAPAARRAPRRADRARRAAIASVEANT